VKTIGWARERPASPQGASTVDNVVKMPDSLERRAQRIEAALDRQEDSIDVRGKATVAWKAATLELATELAGAKSDLNNSNTEFGRWCKRRFGDNRLPPNDVAALVRWGGDPEGTKVMLARDDSLSIQMIDRRSCNSTKTPKPPGGKAFEPIAVYIKAHEAATGALPSEKEITKATGASSSTVHTVSAVFRALRAVGDSTAPIKFSKTQEAHIEARVKALDAEREKTFEARVIAKNQAEIAELFPKLQEIQDQAVLNERLYRELIAKQAIFTEAQCLDIIKACHPDNSATEDVRRRAFVAINAKKLQLTGKR
jgi:hypothetical protein